MEERKGCKKLDYVSEHARRKAELLAQRLKPADLMASLAFDRLNEDGVVQRYIPETGEADRGSNSYRLEELLKAVRKVRPAQTNNYLDEGWY